MSNEAPTVDYRALLEEERDALADQLAELGFDAAGGPRLNYDSNFADSSQVTAERGEVEALVNELRNALGEVQRALQKLAAGTYGTCERCGQEINPARLEAMPAVKYCISCASSHR